MFGIPGLDALGLFHSLTGVGALLAGFVVLRIGKGTRAHRRWGYTYFAAMAALNGTALLIYDLFGRFGPFHIAAVVSLATLLAGFLPAFRRRPSGAWVHLHGTFMSWSYVGLVAAFIAEVAVRVPGVPLFPAAAGGFVVAMAVGGYFIPTRVPRIVNRLAGISSRSAAPPAR